MNRLVYTFKSLRYYRRTHLGVLLGAAFAAAVLVGALTVGDSVHYSLTQLTLSRLGAADYLVFTRERFFHLDLADRMQLHSPGPAVPILKLTGMAVTPDETGRINEVQVVGVNDQFWQLAPEPFPAPAPGPGECLVNQAFSDRLGALSSGDTFVLRIGKPGGLPADMTLSSRGRDAWSNRLEIVDILDPGSFGHFTLRTTHSPPPTVFIPLSWLQKQLNIEGRANALLISDPAAETSLTRLQRQLDRQWQLKDVGIVVTRLENGMAELQSEQVFIAPAVVDAARAQFPEIMPVITYFVNRIDADRHFTPYSFVTAPAASIAGKPPPRGQVFINAWLADDLKAAPGDSIMLTYYRLDSGLDLVEKSARFTVAGVITMEAAARDRSLTPRVPGLTDVDNCRNWDPGIPVKLELIRDQDEAYWNEYGPLPKVYLHPADALRLWANRFGTYTALRLPAAAGSVEEIIEKIGRRLKARDLGLTVQPVKAQGLAASRDAVDFGRLFTGLSFFLITASILLTALLFAFNVQLRGTETGTLRAFGFSPAAVRNLLIFEGFFPVLAGAVLGGFAALGYNALILKALQTIWQDAVRTSAFQLHARPSSIIIGIVITIAAALISMTLAAGRQARLTIHELQQSEITAPTGIRSFRHWLLATGVSCLLAVFGLALIARPGRDREAMWFFFSAGSLLLIGLLALCGHALLAIRQKLSRPAMGHLSLAVRGAALRPGRSLACISLLALGVFLVIAVAANRRGTGTDPAAPAGGSGGYLLWGRTTIPLVHNLNTGRGRAEYGLTETLSPEVRFTQLRLYEGDDASCLNLHQAETPHLLGVDPAEFDQRNAFTFTRLADTVGPARPWQVLRQDLGPGIVPGLADQADITWGMGKSIGDTLTYTDEKGEQFKVKIMGGLANSIMQGHVLISEEHFKERFPSTGGYRIILVDGPGNRARELQQVLTDRLADSGFESTTTQRRLAEFNSVENTYLSIFMVLGGLGVLLGSAGMGIVAARNILERRSELAVLRAVGFSRRRIRKLIFLEHAILATAGVLTGGCAALAAAAPTFLSPEAAVPWSGLLLTLAAIPAGSLLWIHLATICALQGRLLPALRRE